MSNKLSSKEKYSYFRSTARIVNGAREEKLSFAIDDQGPPIISHTFFFISMSNDRRKQQGKKWSNQKNMAFYRHLYLS